MKHSRISPLVIACVGAALWAQTATAQAPRAGAVSCDTILTQKKAAAIVGTDFQGPAVREPRPGFTSCEWQGQDANFAFTFTSTSALRADATTADQAFDNDLVAVENDARKRKALAKIGLKAARVDLGDGAFIVEVKRADGVARMTFYKVPEAKMLALARAVGTR